jgi:hypothetical protein
MSSADFEIIRTPLSNPDRTVLAYPFSFIRDSENANDWCADYDTKDFSESLLSEEKCECGKFPDNIVEFYWIHEGENDEEPWKLLCKLDNGNYAFYLAWCDYTGFDCQGAMKLIISKDLRKLFYEGLTEAQREMCIKEKGA